MALASLGPIPASEACTKSLMNFTTALFFFCTHCQKGLIKASHDWPFSMHWVKNNEILELQAANYLTTWNARKRISQSCMQRPALWKAWLTTQHTHKAVTRDVFLLAERHNTLACFSYLPTSGLLWQVYPKTKFGHQSLFLLAPTTFLVQKA